MSCREESVSNHWPKPGTNLQCGPGWLPARIGCLVGQKMAAKEPVPARSSASRTLPLRPPLVSQGCCSVSRASPPSANATAQALSFAARRPVPSRCCSMSRAPLPRVWLFQGDGFHLFSCLSYEKERLGSFPQLCCSLYSVRPPPRLSLSRRHGSHVSGWLFYPRGVIPSATTAAQRRQTSCVQ